MGETDRRITDALVKAIPSSRKLFDKFPWLVQFLNFGLVGLSNTMIAYVVYAILVTFNMHPQIANVFSFATSLLNAYLLNRFWTFKKDGPSHPATPFRFLAVYGGNYLFGVAFLWVMIDLLHVNKYIVPFLSLPITVPLNFIMNKHWVFKAKSL